MGEDGSIGYKGPSKGAFYSMLASTAFGAAGAGINAGTGLGGWQAGMVSTTANALGSGFQFNDDGSSGAYDWKKAGISFASNTASTFASYGAGEMAAKSGISRTGTGLIANQVGRAANVLTASLLGDKNAVNAYMPQGIFSTIGTNMGDFLADRVNNRNNPSNPSNNSQPLRELFGGATMITARREQEDYEGFEDLFTGDTDEADRKDALRSYFGNASLDDGETGEQLMRMAQKGLIGEDDMQAIMLQQAANSVGETGTKKLTVVPKTSFDKLMGNLGDHYGTGTENMEFMYVMKNNPDLDPNDAVAYEAARDQLKAKMASGGTVLMPEGVGEYTGAFDKAKGYDKTRMAMAMQAMDELQFSTGNGGNKFLLGMDSITGRQGLNLTRDEALQMELALSKYKSAPEVPRSKSTLSLYTHATLGGINSLLPGTWMFREQLESYLWKYEGELSASDRTKMTEIRTGVGADAQATAELATLAINVRSLAKMTNPVGTVKSIFQRMNFGANKINSEALVIEETILTRLELMGRTPGKSSATGKQVIETMRQEGKIMEDPLRGTMFQASNQEWYPLKLADMAHKTDAVVYWNTIGRNFGAKSPEVRQWMLDPGNYTLDYFSINRRLGAELRNSGVRYLPPLN